MDKNAFGTSFKFGARKGILIKIEELNILFEALQKINYTWKGARCFITEWNNPVITGQPQQLFVGPKIRSVSQSSLGNYAISLWEDYLNTQTSDVWVHELEELVFKSECSHNLGVGKDIWLFSIYKQTMQFHLSPRLELLSL